MRRAIRLAIAAASAGLALGAFGQPVEPVLTQAKAQRDPFLASLKEFVDIESGSADREGLDRIADRVAEKLREVGGNVEILEPRLAEVTRPDGTVLRPGRMVRATFAGKGKRTILLLAHMDTVYAKGQLALNPFRIEGNRVYGLGVADDKQGIALISHTLAMLKALGFDEYGTLTVLVNGDEEIGSRASRDLITELGASHDATLSFEGSGVERGALSLATAGLGSVKLRVRGTPSHAGVSPERGVNAIYELAHQILQMRDLSDPARGTKVNWTLAYGGSVLNVIPPMAEATADVRVLRVEDYEEVERKVRARAANQLLPRAKVEVTFSRGRPPLVATASSRALAQHAQAISAEVGVPIGVDEKSAGGGTDAAYAALKATGPVVESLGVRGSGSHSGASEYIALDSIEPRLYLAARLIMDISRDTVPYGR